MHVHVGELRVSMRGRRGSLGPLEERVGGGGGGDTPAVPDLGTGGEGASTLLAEVGLANDGDYGSQDDGAEHSQDQHRRPLDLHSQNTAISNGTVLITTKYAKM